MPNPPGLEPGGFGVFERYYSGMAGNITFPHFPPSLAFLPVWRGGFGLRRCGRVSLFRMGFAHPFGKCRFKFPHNNHFGWLARVFTRRVK